MKFCPECGKPLQIANPRFCPECGADINLGGSAQANHLTESGALPIDEQEDEFQSVRLNTYDLGVNLENMTAAIFGRMGYSVEKRKRVPTRSGATAEIDLLIRRGERMKAVECKNYDESRPVGVSDLRVFNSKLTESGIFAGIFVTNSAFSEDSEKFAESTGLELWDGDRLREMRFQYELGRIRDPSLLHDPILPLETDFAAATRLPLKNSHLIRIAEACLLYHPYIQVKFRLRARRKDPKGKVHTIQDEGTYFVDALDGDIINQEKNVIQHLGVLLKKKEKRMQSREDKMVSLDLKTRTPITAPVLQARGYKVAVAEPEVTEKEAVNIVQGHVIEVNTETISYEIKVKGEMKTRHLTVVPRLKEISIRGTQLIYVPKWIVEFEALQSTYSRRIMASSGAILEDDLAKCSKCTLLRKSSTVICESCGRTLCEKHAYFEGRWLCQDHISGTLKEEIKSKGLLSRLKSGLIQ